MKTSRWKRYGKARMAVAGSSVAALVMVWGVLAGHDNSGSTATVEAVAAGTTAATSANTNVTTASGNTTPAPTTAPKTATTTKSQTKTRAS